MKRLLILSTLFFIVSFSQAEEAKQVPSVIHLHTKWSYASIEPEEIAQMAHEAHIPVVILTESALRRWEYTLFPWLGPLIQKKVEQPSVIKMGAVRYLENVQKLQKQFPDLLWIPSVEVAPHYYWEGSVLKKNLVLRDWNKHLLVLGLNKPRQIEKLPLTSNPKACFLQWRTFVWLWPLLFIGLGWFLYRMVRVRQIQIHEQKLEVKDVPFRLIGLVLIGFGALVFLNNFPFTDTFYSPQGGAQGAIPYQKVIDYVKKEGGLVFWAHPESAQQGLEGAPVELKTPPYPELLLQTKNYDGFAIFFEGYRAVGGVGGVWDQVLMEYIQGRREHPVWAIGELDYRAETLPVKKPIDEVETLLWVSAISQEQVLQALKTGQMYARWNHPEAKLTLSQYELKEEDGQRAFSGQTLSKARKVYLLSKVEVAQGKSQKVTLQVIRNGKLWKEVEGQTPLSVVYEDEPKEKTYYRVYVTGKYPLFLATNPIFCDP